MSQSSEFWHILCTFLLESQRNAKWIPGLSDVDILWKILAKIRKKYKRNLEIFWILTQFFENRSWNQKGIQKEFLDFQDSYIPLKFQLKPRKKYKCNYYFLDFYIFWEFWLKPERHTKAITNFLNSDIFWKPRLKSKVNTNGIPKSSGFWHMLKILAKIKRKHKQKEFRSFLIFEIFGNYG